MLTLSDAIRLGSLLHPQCYRKIFVFDGDGDTVLASCALGAAELAGYSFPMIYHDQSAKTCPRCLGYRSTLAGVIQHLNDDHRWTREAIADWVESIEIASGVRAEGDHTEIPAARAPSPNPPDGGDREKEFSVV